MRRLLGALGNKIDYFTPTMGPEIALDYGGPPTGALGANVPRIHGGAKGAAVPVRCAVWDGGGRRRVLVEVDIDLYSRGDGNKVLEAARVAFAAS